MIRVYLLLLIFLADSVLCDDAIKNHRSERRQDDSFLFFGGWRPVKPGSRYYHGSQNGKFHDILSALPGSLDASSRYYTHALPSNYHKDIYNYYPRPAIRSKPKKNTPVYMETYKPKEDHKRGRGGGGVNLPQLIDIQQLELKHLRGLQNVLLHAQEVPLNHLNLPIHSGKPYEIVEVSVQQLQNGLHRPSGGHRNVPRNNKSIYGMVPQMRAPPRPPVQYQYFPVPAGKVSQPQFLAKEVAVAPLSFPNAAPSIEEVLGIKNIQIVEVPVPAGLHYGTARGKGTRVPQGSRGGRKRQTQPRIPSPPKVNYPAKPYFPPEQHQKQPQHANTADVRAPEIEAELVKLSEEEIKNLIKSFQGSEDILKYLPVSGIQKQPDDDLHLLVAVPQGELQQLNQGSQSGYGTEQPQRPEYSTEGRSQYQEQTQKTTYKPNQNEGYQVKSQNDIGPGGYQNPGGESYGHQQTGQEQGGYQQGGYIVGNGHQDQNGHAYIEVLSPHTDDSGYRREPVLAVELQDGQSVEDAIKALDPETLQQLGAHSKEGLEIEVVEVPVEDYASESKKSETVVASTNSTVTAKTKTTTEAKT